MTTLADLAARRKPRPKSYVVQIWDPIRLVWVVETLERFKTLDGATQAAKRRTAHTGCARVVDRTDNNSVVCEFGVK